MKNAIYTNNYADDNSLDSSTDNFADVLHNLKHDGGNAIEWFTTKMVHKQCNPVNFHFMLFSPTPTEQKVLLQCVDKSLMSETEVTVLGVTVDDKLYFSQHISACCKKVARVIFLSYDISLGKWIIRSLKRSKKWPLEYGLPVTIEKQKQTNKKT